MKTKNWWQSKTVWANIITAIVALIVAVQTHIDLPAQVLKWTLLAVSVLNIVFRLLTGSPITNSFADPRVGPDPDNE